MVFVLSLTTSFNLNLGLLAFGGGGLDSSRRVEIWGASISTSWFMTPKVEVWEDDDDGGSYETQGPTRKGSTLPTPSPAAPLNLGAGILDFKNNGETK